MKKMILAAMFVVALAGMPLTASLGATMDLYVSGPSGNDSSTCQSANNGCLTIQAAIDRIPIVLDRNVNIHIAPGTYAESVLLTGRLAPKGHTIRLVGNAYGVRIDGQKEKPNGILITRSPRVVLENLEVTGFTEAGVLLLHSDASLVSSLVFQNLSHGVVCEYGNLVIESSDPVRGVGLLANAGSGLFATACHVRFQGPAVITKNGLGVLAAHGGLIDFAARTDVFVTNNPPQPPDVVTGPPAGTTGEGVPGRYPMPSIAETGASCQLVADCHGMVMGYENAQIDGCNCAAVDYGVCHPLAHH